MPAEQDWNKNLLQTRLAALPANYTTLRDRHVAKHSEMFDRVAVDFGASAADRSKSNEDLLAEQKTATTPNLALFERMFNSGRYHLIGSSSATAPPDLLGNWTGDSNVGWDGYYHLDANLNLQISGGNIGDLPEVMQGYWAINKALAEGLPHQRPEAAGHPRHADRRQHAQRRGPDLQHQLRLPVPVRHRRRVVAALPVLGVLPDQRRPDVPGAAVLPADPGHGRLLRGLPGLQGSANGKYVFAGSISPENRPAGGVPLSVNSVYDISGARFALETLIATSKTLGRDADKIAVWQEKLDNLPPYLVNDDGALAEWAWPDLADKNAYQHRHSSGLMPVWPYGEVTPEKNKGLYDAAKVFLQKKDGGSYENAGHGLLHGALIAANLNNADSVNAKLMRFAKDDYYYSSLATSHYNNKGVFATDVVNSVPTIMMEMLALRDPGYAGAPPGPAQGPEEGSISGLKGKSRFTIDQLSWDMDTHKARVTITSDVDQNLTLIQRAGIEQITGGTVQNSPLGGIARVVPLKAGQPVTLDLTLRDVSRGEPGPEQDGHRRRRSRTPTRPPPRPSTATRSPAGPPSEDPANWVQVDLGGVYALTEADLLWEAAYARKYKLQVSTDAAALDRRVHPERRLRRRGEDPAEHPGPLRPHAGRGEGRPVGLPRSTSSRLYGQEAPNIALGKTALASSASNASQTAAAAFDGDGSSR